MEGGEGAKVETGTSLKGGELVSLPDWKKVKDPFIPIASLNIDTEDKDTLVLWWKMNSQKSDKLRALKNVSTSINLPHNEQAEIRQTYAESVDGFNKANTGLLDLIAKKNEGLVRRVVNFYATTLGSSGRENQARALLETIKGFNESEEDLELSAAVGQAIIDARSANPDENLIRQKTAQHVFDEMINQLAYARIATVNDIDVEVSGIIDSPTSERSELTSALLADKWSGEERRKMLANYKRLKRSLDRVEADTETKVALNTLWKWANGELPKTASVFKILEYAHSLDEGVTDSLGDAWEYEGEVKANEAEDEDE